MDLNLLDKMLAAYQDQGTLVTVVLQNRARVTGKVRAYDNYVLVLEGQRTEFIYRHAISSLLPASAAAEQRPAPPRTAQAKPAPRPAKPAAAAPKQRPPRPAEPRMAASAEPALNTGMKEGLLRWMQERKASK